MRVHEYLRLILDGNWALLLRNALPAMLVGGWLMFFGAAVVSILPRRRPDWVAALAPSMGFGALVIFLSNVGLFTGVENSFVFWPMVTLGVLVIARHRRHITKDLRPWIVPWLLGLGSALLFGLIPLISISDGRVLNHPSTNHDAFYYASNENWVAHHSILDKPVFVPSDPVLSDSPGMSSALLANDFNVRQGEALVAGFFNTWPHMDLTTTIYTGRVAWLWLCFVSVLGASCLLGLSRKKSVLAAMLTASTWQVTFQMYNQNMAAMLGLALVPLSMALGLAYRRHDDQRRWIVWSGGFLFAVLITTYGELLPFAGLGFLLCAADRKIVSGASIGGILRMSVVALLASPYSSLQAARTVLRISGLRNSLGVPQFWGRPILDMTGAVFGLPSDLVLHSAVTILVIITIMLGLVMLSRATTSLGPLVWVAILGLLWVRLGKSGAYYSVDRLVQTMTCTVIWVAVVGMLLHDRSGNPLRTSRRSIPPLALLGFTSVIAPLQYLRATGGLDWRTFSKDVPRIADYVRTVSPSGEDVMVSTNNYVDRLWITNSLASDEQVEYAFLTPDYFYTLTRFDDDKPDDYLLSNMTPVGQQARVLERAGEYRLFDMRRLIAGVLAPVRQDQLQLDSGAIKADREIEFRVLVWGPGSADVTLGLDGLTCECRVKVDGQDVAVKVDGKALALRLGAGSHTVQIFDKAGVATRNWTVRLKSVVEVG